MQRHSMGLGGLLWEGRKSLIHLGEVADSSGEGGGIGLESDRFHARPCCRLLGVKRLPLQVCQVVQGGE